MSPDTTGNKAVVHSAWRSIVISGCITAVMFISIPVIEKIFRRQDDIILREIETVNMPQPEKEPSEQHRVKEEEIREYRLPRPELEKVPRQLLPLQIAVSLNLAPETGSGDFDLDFARSPLEIPSTELIFDLAEVDRPPRAIHRISPLYPFTARRRGLEGRVVLKFIVKANGSVGDISVIRSAPEGVFDTAAVNAVKQWKFKPASKRGKSVNCWIIQPIRFELERQ